MNADTGAGSNFGSRQAARRALARFHSSQPNGALNDAIKRVTLNAGRTIVRASIAPSGGSFGIGYANRPPRSRPTVIAIRGDLACSGAELENLRRPGSGA